MKRSPKDTSEEELYRLLGMDNPRGNDRELPAQLKKMFGLEDEDGMGN